MDLIKKEITDNKIIDFYYYLRSFCLEIIKKHKEVLIYSDDQQGIVFSNSNKMSGVIFYIHPLSSSINVGFFDGDLLKIEFKRLVGTGKKLRHIKYKSKEELNELELKKIIEKAISIRKQTK